MPRVKLVLEYDGTDFVGWQVQPNGPSIQGHIESALAIITGEQVNVAASGRTDAGVHARGQVAAFTTSKTLPLRAYIMGVNSNVPDDIAVVSAEVVADDFDARRWASGKRYVYRINNRRVRSPLNRRFEWSLFGSLDVGAMRAASQVLLGTHDFSAFRAADCQAKHATRTVRSIAIDGESESNITLRIEGNAFLKHMVRNIVGSLVEIGRGRQSVDWLKRVLDGRDRTQAGPTAPAQGLMLDEVFYERDARVNADSHDD